MDSPRRPEIVVITGGSAGVGRATAIAFALRGAYIGLLARGRDSARIGGRGRRMHGDPEANAQKRIK